MMQLVSNKWTFVLTIFGLIFTTINANRGILWNSTDVQQMTSTLERSDHNDFEQFRKFMKTYERSYHDLNEVQERFKIFRQNLLNAQHYQAHQLGTAKFGVTRFSDLTTKEFLKKFTGFNAHESKLKTKSKSASPNSFKINPISANGTLMPNQILQREQTFLPEDWHFSQCERGFCCPIKNQGHCGSCYAFATIAVIEAFHAQQTQQLICLSEQEIVNCDRGCNGGNFPDSTNAIRQMGGIAYEEDYPYHEVQEQCRGPSSRWVNINQDIVVNGNEASYYDALIRNLVFVAIDATPLQHYREGIIKTRQQSWQINHAVALQGIGFEQGQYYWIVRNSWSAQWGEAGNFRMSYGVNELGVTNMGVGYSM